MVSLRNKPRLMKTFFLVFVVSFAITIFRIMSLRNVSDDNQKIIHPMSTTTPKLTPTPTPSPKSTSSTMNSSTNSSIPSVIPELGDVTIVTAYLNLGSFQKGPVAKFDPDTYKNWAKSWARISNRVVAYFDDESFLKQFGALREIYNPNRTELVLIERKELHAFSHEKRIAEIYSNKSYPKHHPNTVMPKYPCAMSAKYDVVELAIRSSLACTATTKYVAWLDIGYFRYLTDSKEHIRLDIPEGFNDSKIAFSEAFSGDHLYNMTMNDIIRHNSVWVAGGLFLGTTEKVLELIEDYHVAVNELLDMGFSDSDQQVLIALYYNKLERQPSVGIQGYKCKPGEFGLGGEDLLYFCLGYKMRESFLKKAET